MLARRLSGVGAVTDYEPIPRDEIPEIKGNSKPKADSIFLYFASFAASLTYLGAGTTLVWSSPVIPKLQSNDIDINPLGYPITSFEISLLVGLFNVGSISSPLFCGKLIDNIGRKNTLLLLGSCNGAALIILAISKSVLWMCIARIMNGIVFGGTSIALPIFLSEITEDHNRGKFGCLMSLFHPLGQLYGYTTGYFLSTKLFTLSCAVPVLLHIVLFFFFVPETPAYLLYKRERSKALEALRRYRSNKNSSEIDKDMMAMETTLKNTSKSNEGDMKSLFTQKTSRKGFIIGLGMLFIQSSTGILVLLSFMGPIFEKANSGISGNMTAILVGLLKVTIFFLVANIVERLGRKPLMLGSCILCSISLFVIGLYFFLQEHNLGSYQSYSWLPVASILMFIMSYSFGMGPVPSATVGELFPTNLRSRAFSSIFLIVSLFNAIALFVFPFLMNAIGVSSCIWIFSACTVLGAVFIHFVVPETKGRSIDEIQEMLKGKRLSVR